jgi:hypothetical protein
LPGRRIPAGPAKNAKDLKAMKVQLVNGSRTKGCTYTALTEIARTLEDEE